MRPYPITINRPLVIALAGKAGSGKSVSAQFVCDKFGATKYSFAGPLKKFTKSLFDLSDSQVYGTQAEKELVDIRYNESGRSLLQKLGLEGRKCLDEDIWANLCISSILKDFARQEDSSVRSIYVIEDLRFHNEARLLKNHPSLDSYIIKLIRSGKLLLSGKLAEHPSELEVDTLDPVLIHETVKSHVSPNSEDLKDKVFKVVSKILFDPQPILGIL